ncbi:MAG: PIN domain-containing protein [Planctomycetes bacterium]|nr:PIN domain-containing protein [Planctomycetota bacterium]
MIYIDTGAFLSRHLKEDEHHQESSRAWENLRRRREPCYTSNFVLDETFTLLARRAGYRFAAERARNLLNSQLLVILRPEAEDELKAVDFFEKFSDQEVSYTDCISFVLMGRSVLSGSPSAARPGPFR